MCIKNRLASLREKHTALDMGILQLQKGAGHNSLELKKLKKEKLRIKDEMSRLKNSLSKTAPVEQPEPSSAVVHQLPHRVESSEQQVAA